MRQPDFGWDLPPGCSHRDIEEAFGGGDEPSEEQAEAIEAARQKLEAAARGLAAGAFISPASIGALREALAELDAAYAGPSDPRWDPEEDGDRKLDRKREGD